MLACACVYMDMHIHNVRLAFVNTLFPVTCPHHIYSTTLVNNIAIDNLKYFIYWASSIENSRSLQKCILASKLSESLGRLIVQWFTTDGFTTDDA